MPRDRGGHGRTGSKHKKQQKITPSEAPPTASTATDEPPLHTPNPEPAEPAGPSCNSLAAEPEVLTSSHPPTASPEPQLPPPAASPAGFIQWRNEARARVARSIASGAEPPTPLPPRECMTTPHAQALVRMFAASFAGAKEPINAIKTAMTCEMFDESAIEVDEEHAEERDLEEAAAGVRYKHALRKLKAAFPNELCDWSYDGVCERRRPCRCGRGERAAWPWVLQLPGDIWGFCQQRYCIDKERFAWLEVAAWQANVWHGREPGDPVWHGFARFQEMCHAL